MLELAKANNTGYLAAVNAIINHLNSITQLEQFLGITTNTWVK